MQIELIVGDLWLVQGFRMNWKPWARHKPNPKFVFEIRRCDVIPLSRFLLGRPVVIWDENRYDAKFWHWLHLIAIDLAPPEAFKDQSYFKHFS